MEEKCQIQLLSFTKKKKKRIEREKEAKTTFTFDTLFNIKKRLPDDRKPRKVETREREDRFILLRTLPP